MKLQVLSDLHLESETFEPEPAAGAELLVLAGDIDTRWTALERFRGWPVPVLMVAGNHEFDGRDLRQAWPALRGTCERAGIRLLQREAFTLNDRQGQRIRFVGATRWSDYDLFGEKARPKAMRAAAHHLKRANTTIDGQLFDAAHMREEGLTCRRALEHLLLPPGEAVDATVVITHFAPSIRSADPRFGRQPGTAGFCNADDDLIGRADLWIHGHLHCRHDYLVDRPGRSPTRVVCQARGLVKKGEHLGHDPFRQFDVPPFAAGVSSA